jgi:hypothetical protein
LNIPGIFKKSYIKINLIFGVIILFVFAYFLSFSSSEQNCPLPSFYNEITGEKSISTGLSRSLSEIVRGNLNNAKEHNAHGPRLFIFLLAQLFLRIISSYLYSSQFIISNYIVFSDSIISFILFIVCFWPFIINLALIL